MMRESMDPDEFDELMAEPVDPITDRAFRMAQIANLGGEVL